MWDFIYLGHRLSSSDEDWPDVHKNLAKARQRWSLISRVLKREGANPHISAMFYKAVVVTVLLFGDETWVVTEDMLGVLESFHRQIARRLAGCAPVYLRREGKWSHPPLGNAYEKAGLYTMEEYIARRKNGIVDYIASRPLYDLCCSKETPEGPAAHQYWWNQKDCLSY